jgi:5'-3' exonuclease
MGIRGLERIIKSHSDPINKSIKKTSLSEFRNKYVCIDTSEFIVRSLIKDKRYHVSGILNLLEKCLKYNIIPCFVFDGKPPKEKNVTIQERNKKKQQVQLKIQELEEQKEEMIEINDLIDKLNNLKNSKDINKSSLINDSNNYNINTSDTIDKSNLNLLETDIKREIISRISSSSSLVDFGYTPKSISPTSSISEFDFDDDDNVFLESSLSETIETKLLFISNEKKRLKKKCHSYNEGHISDIQQLLDLLKIPYVNSKCESDIICTSLCKLGIVDAVISNDMDFIILGTPLVIRNMNFKTDDVDLYIYKNILDNLSMSSDKLIELSLLLGCDYCQRVINIKNKYTYDIFNVFENLDDMITNLDNFGNRFVEYYNLHPEYNSNNNLVDITEYIEKETFVLDEKIDIVNVKNMFDLEINERILDNMIIHNKNYSIDLKNEFVLCINHLDKIKNEKDLYNEIIVYCQEKCIMLNNCLIISKLNTICGLNKEYKDYKKNYENKTYNSNNNKSYSSYKSEIVSDIRSKYNKYNNNYNNNYNKEKYIKSNISNIKIVS